MIVFFFFFCDLNEEEFVEKVPKVPDTLSEETKIYFHLFLRFFFPKAYSIFLVFIHSSSKHTAAVWRSFENSNEIWIWG